MWDVERAADESGTTSGEGIDRAHVGMAENRTPRAHVGTANENRPAAPARAGETFGPYAWREVDRHLRLIAARRSSLDAEELRWLARAERIEIHRVLGHASILEYVERVLGYGPRVAKDRLRVARALETLPALATSLETNTLSYSAVREVSRVATPWTEERWIEKVRGKPLREVEQAVAGHVPGDDPDDDPDPDLVTRPITFELTPATLALLRQATRHLEDEVGHPLTDDELVAGLCASALSGDGGPGEGGGAPFQIALTICEACDRGWHDAAGRSYDVPPAVVEQARCDAQHIGRVDADEPARSWQDVPPATRRLVLRRDRGCCTVPGCRSSRWLQIHHIIARALGGTHDPSNLTCLCGGHHRALHEGRLTIVGRAPDALVFGPGSAPPSAGPIIVAASEPVHASVDEVAPDGEVDVIDAEMVVSAERALTTLGFRLRDARAAIARVRAHVGTSGDPDTDPVERLIRAALRDLTPVTVIPPAPA